MTRATLPHPRRTPFPKRAPRPPAALAHALGPYGPQVYDSRSGEPIAWGWRFVQRVGPELWVQAVAYGVTCCGAEPPVWVLVYASRKPTR
jgi:hypothetical protein